MQIQSWDTELKKMMVLAERPKPIITDYPPPDGWKWQRTVGLRMCDGYFTEPGIEAQIVRLEGSSQIESAVYVRHVSIHAYIKIQLTQSHKPTLT